MHTVKSKAGRTSTGRISVRHHGKQTKKNFFLIDSKRVFSKRLALIVNFVNDLNRSALVGLLKYANGAYSYILIARGIFIGQFTQSCQFDILWHIFYKTNYRVFLIKVPHTTVFFETEVELYKGGKYAKSAGTYCNIVKVDKEKLLHMIRLPTGKRLIISSYCTVTLGKNANHRHNKEFLVKAGLNRQLGVRPTVRGVAMNPVDHPHGGRTKISSPEVTPWGKIAKHNR